MSIIPTVPAVEQIMRRALYVSRSAQTNLVHSRLLSSSSPRVNTKHYSPCYFNTGLLSQMLVASGIFVQHAQEQCFSIPTVCVIDD